MGHGRSGSRAWNGMGNDLEASGWWGGGMHFHRSNREEAPREINRLIMARRPRPGDRNPGVWRAHREGALREQRHWLAAR